MISSDQASDDEGLDDVDCSEGCLTAAVMFGVLGMHVLAARRESGGLGRVVETEQTVAGCRTCGVLGRC